MSKTANKIDQHLLLPWSPEWPRELIKLVNICPMTIHELAKLFHKIVLKLAKDNQYSTLPDLFISLQQRRPALARFIHPETTELLEKAQHPDHFKALRQVIAKKLSHLPRADASLQQLPYAPNIYSKVKFDQLADYQKCAIGSLKSSPSLIANEFGEEPNGVRHINHRFDDRVISISINEDGTLRNYLGKGSFGSVHQADWECVLPVDTEADYVYVKCSNQSIVIKSSKEPIEADEQRLLELLYQGSGVNSENDSHHIIMQQAKGNNLQQLISQRICSSISRLERIRLALKMIAITETLHQQGIIHADIKPQQFIVEIEEDKVQHVSLIDFGFAGRTSSKSRKVKMTLRGTPGYTAPELFHNAIESDKALYDAKTDSYALGISLAELFAGEADILFEINQTPDQPQGHRNIDKETLQNLCNRYAEIDAIAGLIDPDPRKRISLKQAEARLEKAMAAHDPVAFLKLCLKFQPVKSGRKKRTRPRHKDPVNEAKAKAIDELERILQSSDNSSLSNIIAQMHCCIIAAENKQKQQHKRNIFSRIFNTKSRVSRALKKAIIDLNEKHDFNFVTDLRESIITEIDALNPLNEFQTALLSQLLKQPNQLWHKHTELKPQSYFVQHDSQVYEVRLRQSIVKQGKNGNTRYYVLPHRSQTGHSSYTEATIKMIDAYFVIENNELQRRNDANLTWKPLKVNSNSPGYALSFQSKQQLFEQANRELAIAKRLEIPCPEVITLSTKPSDKSPHRKRKIGLFMQRKQGVNLAEKWPTLQTKNQSTNLELSLELLFQMLVLAKQKIDRQIIHYHIGLDNLVISEENKLSIADFSACALPHQPIPLQLLPNDVAMSIDPDFKRIHSCFEQGRPVDTTMVAMSLAEGQQLMLHQLAKAFLSLLNPQRPYQAPQSLDEFTKHFIGAELAGNPSIGALYDLVKSMLQKPNGSIAATPIDTLINEVNCIRKSIVTAHTYTAQGPVAT